MAYIGKSPGTGIRNRFIYTATAGQTTFSGSDDHSRTLSYTDAEFVDVFLNGVKLDKSDYTATSGTSVVLDEGAAVDDILEVLAFDVFSVFSGEFSQDVTVGGKLTTDNINGGQVGGRRNFIYNGAMTVWQRGTSDDTASNNDYMCDRWQIGFTGLDGNVDWDRSTDTPDGFSYSLKVSMDASETSLDAADRIHIQQKFEGQDLQHLRYGSSGAKTCTVSFWVKSSVAGTYTLNVFQNEAVTNRQISKSYTIDTADTWEHKTITFAGDTSTAINNDDAEGLRLGWWLDAGSNFTSGTFATNWEDYVAANRVHSTTGWLESTSPEFYITGVQLEVGNTATEFEYRSFGDELALCQRYCVKIKSHRHNPQLFGRGWDSDSAQITLSFPVQMRGEDFQYQGTGSFTKHGNVAINAYASSGNNVTAIGNWVVVGTQVAVLVDTSASVSGGSTVWWTMADDAYFLLENEL